MIAKEIEVYKNDKKEDEMQVVEEQRLVQCVASPRLVTSPVSNPRQMTQSLLSDGAGWPVQVILSAIAACVAFSKPQNMVLSHSHRMAGDNVAICIGRSRQLCAFTLLLRQGELLTRDTYCTVSTRSTSTLAVPQPVPKLDI